MNEGGEIEANEWVVMWAPSTGRRRLYCLIMSIYAEAECCGMRRFVTVDMD